MLSMQRIPHGLHNANQTRKGVVLFQHGLTDNSNGVCLNPPSEGLPFILADAGYEVWLGNNRGNGHSMINLHYTPEQDEFWDFSWDEFAQYDLPSQINFALSISGAKQLSYIGHSEGSTQAFAGFLNYTVAASVNVFIGLAPACYTVNVESLIVRALADLDTVEIFELLGVQEFYLPDVIEKLLPDICEIDPGVCQFDIDLVAGPTTFLNTSRMSYYLNFEPNPTSVKNMAHWAQQTSEGTYGMFDYGYAGNMQHYGQPTPPQYDLQKFPKFLPVAIFAGGEDYLADPTDVATLISLLPSPPMVHDEPDYAHLDFIWSINANQRIFPLVVQLLDKYNKPLQHFQTMYFIKSQNIKECQSTTSFSVYYILQILDI